MPLPNDSFLPGGVQINRLPNGNLVISEALVDILVASRNKYDWPNGTGATKSQSTIIKLEAMVAGLVASLDPTGAHSIVRKVSSWGGNNRKAQAVIDAASLSVQKCMLASIRHILNPATLRDGLDDLSQLPGLRLVMATKVYRFCCPNMGAAVDRHTSYFFNSLEIVDPNGSRRKSTNFRREWSNGGHSKSRLAIYYPSGQDTNRDEFVNSYLPLLAKIANSLNESGVTYSCAATGTQKPWRPADVEMAAYYWWACNGSS